MKKLATLILLCLGCIVASAQDIQRINLDSATNLTTIQGPGAGLRLYDDGGPDSAYSRGRDYCCIIESTCDSSDTATTFLSFSIMGYDIGPYDTLYVYDGPTINDPLIVKFNNSYQSNTNSTFYIGRSNTSRKICVRFRTDIHHSDDTIPHFGFALSFDCSIPCETVVAVIDDLYERLDADGNVLGSYHFTPLPTALDTIFERVWVVDFTGEGRWTYNRDSIIRIDTIGWTDGALLCNGQQIRFHGHGEYGSHYGYYHPTDSTTLFHWDFSKSDTSGVNYTSPVYGGYNSVGCYDIILQLTDQNGCTSKNHASIQVRLAQNPIKTIFDLGTICNNDSLMVNVGYGDGNGALSLKKIQIPQVVSKENQARTFIPDGPQCATRCYSAPVTFEEFPSGRLIESADDICSICVNYEHSYMGDYSLAITCPTYDPASSAVPTPGKAYLKYKERNDIPNGYDPPDGTWGGSGQFTGCPAGGSLDDEWDGLCGDGDVCDSLCNPYGVGLNYCFSRNEQYLLVSGEPCNTPNPTDAGLASSGHTSALEFQMPIMGSGYANAGVDAGILTVSTKDSSNRAEMTDYYIPADDFSTLVGCPLNGTWNIEICDNWKQDNGWVFGWSMDICNINKNGVCDYQVGIDSVVWRPDTLGTATYVDGIYQGLIIRQKWNDNTAAYILSPDTCGDFGVKVSVYDEFGCQWDARTPISTVCTPTPSLGNDTAVCDAVSFTLDATDRRASEYYSYLWEPFGETTPTITTTAGTKSDHTYIVEVTNFEKGIRCAARDTIDVRMLPSPIPNFDPGTYPLEGCEPMTFNFTNTTKNGYKYRWDFGDGTYSSLQHPSHSYAAGTYDLKYYVESEAGCKDSLLYPGLITIFQQPKAQFSWEPTFPSVQHPEVNLLNRTDPDNSENIYLWEIQYNPKNPYSFHTLTDKNSTFRWTPAAGGEIAGNYTVRLIARTDNYGPSGHLTTCADTIENTIMLINDQLEFPNLVTPNGDGINDRFVINNLVEGLAYPINQLDIYDKVGVPVFHVENISKMADFWDPAATKTPSGTYYFHFIGRGYRGDTERNGVIEVIR